MNKLSSNKLQLQNVLKVFLIMVVLFSGLKLLLNNQTLTPVNNSDGPSTRESFSKCLNERGVIMYGVDTCQYCETQKKMFGLDFREINYINCDFETEQCDKMGITAYPVWQVGEKLLAGIQTFNTLATESGCQIPK